MYGDVAFAVKREQMVLAETVEADVLRDDHLVVLLLEDRPVEELVDILRVAAREKSERFRDALGRPAEPLAIGILAELGEHLPYQLFHLSTLSSAASVS